MATSLWGTTSLSDFSIVNDAGDQLDPAVADSGGGSFGVAWTSSAGVTARFYDVVGQVDPALGTLILSDAFYANTTDQAIVQHVALTAGGSGIGYAAVWEETSAVDASAQSILRGRYVGPAGIVGGEFTINTEVGISQHDAVVAGYGVDGANGKPIVDGFKVVWVSSNPRDIGVTLTQQQFDAGYGQIMLQRFAVNLDSRRDPTGPPQAAGLDGVVGGDADQAVNVASAIGRDPSTIVTHDAETVITWIDTDNQVHLRVFSLDGADITAGVTIAGGGTVNDIDGTSASTGAGVTAGFGAKVVDLAGAGFVVAWVGQETIGATTFQEIRAVVFSPGANPGTYTAGQPIVLEQIPAGFDGDFSLGTLLDSGGFSLSYTAGSDVFVKAFDSNGAALGAANQLVTPSNQTNVALAGLIGDRIIAVYEDDASGNQDIGAAIFDTRTQADGTPIALGGPGLTIIGDDVATGRERARADQLVGTIGNDILDGRLSDDELYGALGDDRIIGGAGSDLVDGGGGTDTAVFSGDFADYIITYLGAGLFTVEDTRGGTPDGTDTLRGIELIEFADRTGADTVRTIDLITGIVPVTPTAWGWTDEDPDNAPNADGLPDVDGFIVNHATAGNGDIDRNAFVADSVGEFIGVVWEHSTDGGATAHIQGQFYDVIGAFDAFMPNVVNLSDGVGIETNPVIVSGGANSGWGIAWEELTDASDVSHTIRTNFQGPGFLTGPELTVFDEGELVDQHDAALSGSFLDRTLASPEGGSVLPTGMNEGYNVAWVSTHLDGVDGALPAGYGRIMMQRFEVPLDALGNPGAPVGGGIDGIAGLDGLTVLATADGTDPRDAAFWVGDELGGVAGAFGRNPSTTALHGFETIVIWIEQDGAGGERVAGRAYDDLGQVINVPGLDDISAGYSVAAGTTTHVVSAGAVNFGVVWVTESAPGVLTVMGTMYAPTGAGLNGEGFGFGAPAPFELFDLPAGVSAADLELSATGISGEDSEDLIVSWKTTAGGNANVMAQHILVALDPVTGFVIAMAAEGDMITVNAETAGNQDGATVAGMLGDRFIVVYHDDNAAYTDGNDIVARIIDTRDAVNPDPIIGDLIRNGTPQARRDVLIGTNGNDNIRGDISDADGLVDYIFAGMGDDVIEGGPGLRGAAGIPEIIDGGEGTDVSVYTGRLQDYSITINGDGSFEVIDLRPTQDPATGDPLQHDGIDNLYNIEKIRFLDLAHNGAEAQEIAFGFPGTPPELNSFDGVVAGPYDGTPLVWSLDDTSQYKEITVDTDPTPADAADAKSGINVINLQDGAGLAWISGGTEVWAITYDTTGRPDPILLGANTQLTDGTFAGNTVSEVDVAMTAGLGMTAVWESTNAGDSAIHLRFASTNTHIVLDPAGGVPGPGLPGGEQAVVGSDGSGTAVDPVIQGYEIVNVDNDTLEVGFHVGYVLEDDGALDTSAGDAYGALLLARYEIPVYDILVDAGGLPILDANGQGQLAIDAFGNLVPSTVATFGTGSETAPVSVGLDGLRGTADDGAAIILTNAGLLAASDPLVGSDADHTPIQGRDISIGSLHDGQLVVSYIGADELVHLKIFVPAVDETGDRELTAGNPDGLGNPTDIVATGITAYSELTLPATMTANLGAVVSTGQTAFVVPQQNGSFGVFWAADDGAAGVAVQGIIYTGAGTNWSPSPVITFKSGLPAAVQFEVAATGVTPGGLEDGFFVSWQDGTGILGQRFDMTGAIVGQEIVVGDPTTGTPGLHSTAGIDDGRMIIGYEDENGSVSAQFLDNREPGVALMGPRTGAPRDVIVGTVGDDAIDGRALGDELYGGLGWDLITLGSGADIGFGGLGNDTIIGGTGQDQLLGEEGDDLLWGGLSGPPDAKVDRELVDGLTLAGRLDLVAINPGADIISGGDGIDTISYQGEFGKFDVDLSTGVVLSDRDFDGTFLLEDVMGQLVADAGGATPFQFILDIENATGGIGDDVITGDARSNVLDGGSGNDTLNGGGGADFLVGGAGNDQLNGGSGVDTAVFDKTVTDLTAAMFTVDVAGNWVVNTGGAEGTDTLTGVEVVDGTRFILIGASSDFVNASDAQNSGVLLNGDVLLTFEGFDPVTGAPIITSATFTNDNPDAPVAGDDGPVPVVEDTPTLIDVLGNDTDTGPNTGGLLIEPNSLVATHGTAAVVNNQILFTPEGDYNGPASVQYRVLDTPAAGAPRLSNVATVTIDITGTPDGPTAVDDEGVAVEAAVTAGQAAADNLLINDLDPDLPYGDFLTVISAAGTGGPTAVGAAFTTIQGQFGTLHVKANGDFTYDADNTNATVNALTTGQTLDDIFSYTIQDSLGTPSTATLTVTIEGANDAPILSTQIVDQTASATTPFSFTVPPGTFTDVDTPNLALSATLADGSALSTIGLSFNPATRTFSGSGLTAGVHDIRITAFDGLSTASDVFTLTVLANQAPTDILFDGVSAPASLPVNETGGVVATLTGVDPENGPLTFSLANSAEGRFAISGNQIVVADPSLIDFEDPSNPSHSFVVSVLARDAGGLTYAETVAITSTNVTENPINGTAGRDTLNGTAGNDIINGLANRDTMSGGAGNDTYFVDNSGDRVNENANAGNDTIYVSGITSWTLGNNVENLIYTGSANGTTWKGNNANNTIVGGSGNDQIQGGSGDDHLIGNAGNDTINGDNGNDRLYGGAGNDRLDGGRDNDVLDGGAGNDTLIVSSGNDTILLRTGFGNDTATGFDSDAAGGQDLIDVSSYGLTESAIGSQIQITGTATLTLIAIGADTLTLTNVNSASIDKTDFIF